MIHGERIVPLPCAFDARIGYWTGEPDWSLVVEALQAGSAGIVTAAEIESWLRDARARPAALVLGAVTVQVQGDTIVVRGDEAAVGALAASLQRAFSGS